MGARKRKPKTPAHHRPLPCVIVAVDPGRRSGWATLVEGRPVSWGTLDAGDVESIERVLRAACELAERADLPLVIIGEEWNVGGNRGMRQWQGLGAAWGSWQFAAERLSAEGRAERTCTRRIVADRIRRVSTSTWRAEYGICRRPKGAPDDWHKTQAVRLVGERLKIDAVLLQHDAAEALLIGAWAAHAHAVSKKLPKLVMRRWQGAGAP